MFLQTAASYPVVFKLSSHIKVTFARDLDPELRVAVSPT